MAEDDRAWADTLAGVSGARGAENPRHEQVLEDLPGLEAEHLGPVSLVEYLATQGTRDLGVLPWAYEEGLALASPAHAAHVFLWDGRLTRSPGFEGAPQGARARFGMQVVFDAGIELLEVWWEVTSSDIDPRALEVCGWSQGGAVEARFALDATMPSRDPDGFRPEDVRRGRVVWGSRELGFAPSLCVGGVLIF